MTIPRAVFFDWDGTLVETLQFIFSAHNHVRTHFGIQQWSFDEYKEHMRFSSVELYPRIYGNQADEAVKVLGEFVENNHLETLTVTEGAEALLESLHQINIPMGVVSNKRQAFLIREINHLGWEKYFKAIVGAGVAAKDKPEGDPLIFALAKADLQPGPDILYVGDAETDLLCAGAAGCATAFLYHAQPDNPLIQGYNPKMVVKNCIDLANELLLPLNQHKYVS